MYEITRKWTLLGNTLLDEGPALADAKLPLICLLVAVGALGGFFFMLLAPFPVSHIQDGGPLLDRHASLDAPVVGTLLSSFSLPIGHALADEFSEIASGYILLLRLGVTLLAILLAERALTHGRRLGGLSQAAIARRDQQPK